MVHSSAPQNRTVRHPSEKEDSLAELSVAAITRAGGSKSESCAILVDSDASHQARFQQSSEDYHNCYGYEYEYKCEYDYDSEDEDEDEDEDTNVLDVTIRSTIQQQVGAEFIPPKEDCCKMIDRFQDEFESELQSKQETRIATRTKQRVDHWSCSTPYKFTSANTGLSPIAERRVTFAGKVILRDSGRASRVWFEDAVRVSPIPHVSNYSPEDKRILWYSRDELSSIRRGCVQAAQKLMHHPEWYCPHVFRGLESLFDEILWMTNRQYVHSTCRSRRWDAVTAVLEEQHRQRCSQSKSHSHSHAVNQRHGGRTAVNPVRLRRAYITRGKTNHSQSVAHELAKEDERYARDCWMVTKATGGDSWEPYCKEEDDCEDEGQEIECHNRSVCRAPSVLQKMLALFSELRHGDIFLGIGDACV